MPKKVVERVPDVPLTALGILCFVSRINNGSFLHTSKLYVQIISFNFAGHSAHESNSF